MSASKTANSLRRALVARRQARLTLGGASLVLLAFELLLAVEGAWAAAVPVFVVGAVVMWFVGAWVAPWSRDAYVRRVMRLWQDWATDTQLAYDRLTRGGNRSLAR